MTYEIIDDTDPRLVYTGDWRQVSGPLDPTNPEYNGTIHATNDPTATLSYYNFYGKVLDIFGSISAAEGAPNATFSITPNGVSPQHLNQYGYVPTVSDGIASHMWLFKSGAFPERHYNMTLIVDGVSPGGPTFYFDYLRVQVATGLSVETAIMDDADQHWVFDDPTSWEAVHQTGDYLYETRQSPNAGGTSEIAFYGTEVTLYGGLSGTYDTQREIASFKIDDGAYQRVFASDITDETSASTGVRNHKIFSTSGVNDIGTAPHTLTISVPPSTGTVAATPLPQTSPWFIDYIVFGPVTTATSSIDIQSISSSSYTITSYSSSFSTISPFSPSITSTPIDSPLPSAPILSSSAKVGIIISCTTIGLAVVLALLIWFRRRRRYKSIARFRTFPWITDNVPSSPSILLLSGNGRQTKALRKHASEDREAQMAEAGPSAPRGVAVVTGRRKQLGGFGHARREIDNESVDTMTQTGASEASFEDEFHRRDVIVREVDGGVRIIPGSSGYDDGEATKVRVLPPSYSQSGR